MLLCCFVDQWLTGWTNSQCQNTHWLLECHSEQASWCLPVCVQIETFSHQGRFNVTLITFLLKEPSLVAVWIFYFYFSFFF